MQQYARAAKELLDNVAKLTIRQQQDGGQQQHQPPAILLQATTSLTGHSSQQQSQLLSTHNSSSSSWAPTAAHQQQHQQQLPTAASSSSSVSRPTVPLEARVSRFKQELLASRINLDELRRLSFQGIPDKDGLRAMTWKLLLGYLPPDPSEWDQVLARKRTEYLLFCEDLIVDPKKAQQQQQQEQQQEEQQRKEQQQQQQQGASQQPAASSSSTAAAADGVEGATATTSTSSSSTGGGVGAAADPLSDPLGGSGAAAVAAVGDPLQQQNDSTSGSSSSRYQQSLAQQQSDPLTSTAQELKCEMPEDHPLSLNSTSKWHTFFKDNEIMEQIDRDVMRTHPDMHFFSGDSPDAEQHRREMKRCLFMYAKLNPGLRYIQGMNELLAPLYYLFRTDPDRTSARYAEADSFYCFVDLISEFRDHFCQQLDNSTSGIKATIGKLMQLMEVHDPQLTAHLVKHKVDPQFFAFRWITLLLTQEFPFPDAVRIWDTLLSDPGGRPDCLMRVCCAMLMGVRQQLLEGDFAVIVKTLQRYPSVDVDQILRAAARLPPCASVLGAPL